MGAEVIEMSNYRAARDAGICVVYASCTTCPARVSAVVRHLRSSPEAD
jgi:hypothetical protein